MPAKNTTKIKLLQGMAGNRLDEKTGQVRATFTYAPGAVIDWPADEAARMIDRGYAELVETK